MIWHLLKNSTGNLSFADINLPAVTYIKVFFEAGFYGQIFLFPHQKYFSYKEALWCCISGLFATVDSTLLLLYL
jgi:hypothetical protein